MNDILDGTFVKDECRRSYLGAKTFLVVFSKVKCLLNEHNMSSLRLLKKTWLISGRITGNSDAYCLEFSESITCKFSLKSKEDAD